MIALDVCNKLVEIHLVSAGKRHEGGSARNLAGVHDLVRPQVERYLQFGFLERSYEELMSWKVPCEA
jgi:hypothetical protein